MVNVLLLRQMIPYHKWEEAPELHNENWDYYNYSKNKLLLESFCVNTDVRLFFK